MSTPAPVQTSILDQLNSLSSAEEFFALLGVDYDPKVVAVVRLHVLRRMGQYLKSEDFSGLTDEIIAARCQTVLRQAYEDFLTSTPMQERVFKVLKDAVATPQKPASLIQLNTLE